MPVPNLDLIESSLDLGGNRTGMGMGTGRLGRRNDEISASDCAICRLSVCAIRLAKSLKNMVVCVVASCDCGVIRSIFGDDNAMGQFIYT